MSAKYRRNVPYDQFAPVYAWCAWCACEIYLGQSYYETEDGKICMVCGPPCRGPRAMTLKEMSAEYRAAAQPLRERLRQLRQAKKRTRDREELFWIDRRMSVLTAMLTQVNELAELTEHYYERGYYRNEKYRL